MKTGKKGRVGPRGQGRPRKGDSSDARELLISAARELLRNFPPAAINRQDIARVAGVDPALVRYYFGNKDNLLLETAQRMMHEMRAERGAAYRDETSFRRKLAAYTRYLIGVLHQYPFLHDLLLEQISRVGSTEARELRADFIDQPWGELRAMLDDAMARGEMRRVDASFFYVALIGMCSFPMRHQVVLSLVRDTDAVDAGTAEAYGEFVADLLIGGIAPGKQAAARPVSRTAAKVA